MEKFYKQRNSIKVRVSNVVWNYILKTYPEYTIEKIKKDYPAFIKWIEGTDNPTITQLKNLSQKYKIPFGYFFLDYIPEEKEKIPFYRKGKKWEGKISPELRELLDKLLSIQGFLAEYLEENEYPAPAFVNSCSINDDYKEVSQKINQLLELKDKWFFDFKDKNKVFNFLRKQIEKTGIFVFASSFFWFNTKAKLNADEFKGFCLINKYAPVIFINTNDFISSQIFTIIHEFAHILLGQSEILSDPEYINADAELVEVFCNKVTSEVLVPEKVFRDVWRSHPQDYNTIADKFNVSPIVIAIKARILDFIKPEQYERFYNSYIQEISERKISKKEGFGDFYTLCRKFFSSNYINIIQRALNDGFISFRDVLNYTGLKESNFDKFINQYERRQLIDSLST